MSGLRASILALLALGASAAGAQNFFTNADFDQDAADWLIVCGTTATWQAEDEAGCPGSGSVHVTSASCQGLSGAAMGQCFPVGALTEVSATGRVKAPSGFVGVGMQFFTTTDCSGVPLDNFNSPPTGASGGWDTVTLDQAIPPGSVSMGIAFGAIDLTPVDADVDAGYAGVDPLIYRDDFEGDQQGETMPCRWSDAVP